MRTNPFSDTIQFLMQGTWPIHVLWLLLVLALALAVYNFRQDKTQRTPVSVWTCLARVVMGAMWWQQTLWKLPPFYTDNPGVQDSGLRHWVNQMIDNSAFGLQSEFVKRLVLPHFGLFAPQVYAIEAFIAISLILGLFGRLGGLLGTLMAMNLWLGLYRASYEWPWTYFFMVLLMATFTAVRSGRSLGADALIARRLEDGKGERRPNRLQAALLLLT